MATRRPDQRQYNALENRASDRFARVTGRLADGKISVGAWHSAMLTAIETMHTRAVVLGRQRAGDLTDEDDNDRVMGAVLADEQNNYLTSFADDIRAGAYRDGDGQANGDAMQARASLYAYPLLASTNEAFVMAGDAEEEYEWQLGFVKERHCMDCPEIAAASPHTEESLAGRYPRSGATACLFRCNCTLVRASDGIEGFGPAE